ncbi:AMP-binding enzyme [Nisaea sp.]|uniref:AMP-binding enzyme n=1 Tax=Nisaea sp. TaxID=2024842 RepID=UPI003B52C78A
MRVSPRGRRERLSGRDRAGERVLLTHPQVIDAALVKVADLRWGERPVAFVARHVGGPNADALMQLCREHMAKYKRPREIRFIASEDFPRSTSGKIQRHVLETWIEREAN